MALTTPKLLIYGINFGPDGYIPFSDFYKIWREEEVPGPHHHTISIVALKMWPYGRQNRQK